MKTRWFRPSDPERHLDDDLFVSTGVILISLLLIAWFWWN